MPSAVAVDARFFIDRRTGSRPVPRWALGGANVHDAASDPADATGAGMPASPSRRLVAAVMWQALVDVGAVAHAATRPGPAAAARWWFANDDETWPLSFRNCCAALGMEADAVRRELATGRPGVHAFSVRRGAI